jgi:biotin carboxylase
MKKVALCLGGSLWQLDLIRAVQARGYRALVADRSPDCPGHEIADVYCQVDTDDVSALLQVARQHSVRLVLAEQTDRVVPVAAELIERLGLPGMHLDVARRFTDKLVMRQSLVASNVPMPAFQEVTRLEQVLRFVAENHYPIILKPRRSQSSIGVFKAHNDSQLRAAFPHTIAKSSGTSILVEEFIEGTEITVEGLCINRVHEVLAVSEKEHYDFNPCVARRLAYPPRFSAPLLSRIRQIANEVVHALGLRDGLTHAEYRINNGEPYLIEVAARGGGTRIAPIIVPWVSGVNVYDIWLRRLEGDTVQLPHILERAAALEFFSFAPGHVNRINGVESASKLTADIRLAFSQGSTIMRPEDDSSRLGHFIVLGATRDEVDKTCATVRDLVSVEYQ